LENQAGVEAKWSATGWQKAVISMPTLPHFGPFAADRKNAQVLKIKERGSLIVA
jgi:hypothetical protein